MKPRRLIAPQPPLEVSTFGEPQSTNGLNPLRSVRFPAPRPEIVWVCGIGISTPRTRRSGRIVDARVTESGFGCRSEARTYGLEATRLGPPLLGPGRETVGNAAGGAVTYFNCRQSGTASAPNQCPLVPANQQNLRSGVVPQAHCKSDGTSFGDSNRTLATPPETPPSRAETRRGAFFVGALRAALGRQRLCWCLREARRASRGGRIGSPRHVSISVVYVRRTDEAGTRHRRRPG
jgi:hypothetical protein